MVRFRWSDAAPDQLNDVELAQEMGATWEGEELVTYNLGSLAWQMENYRAGEYMSDND